MSGPPRAPVSRVLPRHGWERPVIIGKSGIPWVQMASRRRKGFWGGCLLGLLFVSVIVAFLREHPWAWLVLLVVLLPACRRVAVQAKNYDRGNVGNEAVQQAIAAASYYDCQQAMVVTNSGFTKNAVKQARGSNIPVTLIDRRRLGKLIDKVS